MKKVLLFVLVALVAVNAYGAGYTTNAHNTFLSTWVAPANFWDSPPNGPNPTGDWSWIQSLSATNALAVPVTNADWSGQYAWGTQGDGSGMGDMFRGAWFDPFNVIGGHTASIDATGNHVEAIWTAPMTITEPMVKIEGKVIQLWEAARQQALYINGLKVAETGQGDYALHTFGPIWFPVTPGQQFVIKFDGSGSLGNGVGTFAGWDMNITEVPEPMTLVLLGLGSIAALRRRTR